MRFDTQPLSDICKGGGSYGIAASAVEYSPELPTYLRITDINDDGTLNFSGLKSVDDPNASKYYLKPNDIVFARTGASTGRNYFYDGQDGEFVFAGFLIKFSVDPDIVNPKFIKYYCQSKAYYDWVASFNTGSTRGNINAQTLGNMPVPTLPKEQQDLLADTLSALDAKIANNNAINHHLEQMAQVIYSDYAAHAVGALVKLGDICAFQEGYVNPSQTRTEYFGGEVKWLRAVDINESYILNTSRTLTKAGFDSAGKSAFLFKPDTIAISKSGTIGRLGLVADFMCGNRAVINIAPCDSRHLPFVYLYLKSRQPEYPDFAVGSVQKNLYVSILQDLDVVLPESPDLLDFCDSLLPLFEQWKTNVAENISLIKLRDSLLPRLMSGELSIADIVAK